MKRAVSVALLVTLVFSACIPAFAQKIYRGDALSVRKERTRFGLLEAFSDGNGVLVRWEMAVEKENVGFFVYRVGAGDSELVNPRMLPGSTSRAGNRTTNGDIYTVFDPVGDLGTYYFIKSIRSDGYEVSSLKIDVKQVKDLETVTGQSSEAWHATVSSPNMGVAKSEMNLHQELKEIVTESLQAADPVNHRWVVAQPGVKIGVRKAGLYRVTAAQLQAAGFATNGDSTKWRLFMDGVEQAILVGANNSYIEFYGKPIDTIESDTRVYYLISDSVGGKRMATKVLRQIGGTSISPNYPLTTIKKERNSYVSQIINGEDENYWGRVLSSSPSIIPFSLTGLDPTGNVDVSIKLQGYVGANHQVRVILNGNQLADMSWPGRNPHTATYTVPASFLLDGSNTVELTTMIGGDFSLFDSISISHKRRYQAEQNVVSFFTPGYRRVDVTGFTSANIRVFDTTHDGEPALVVGLPIEQNGSSFTVKLPSSRNIVGYAVEDSALLQSPSVTQNIPSTYATTVQPAQLVIISHSAPDFMAAAETWANYRRGQGISVKVIDVGDIFDEYSYGSTSSSAIKNFLAHAYADWQSSYVLLLGDASYDPRNYEGYGYWDLVPTRSVNLIFGESFSDEALVDFNDDGLGELAIGRISARVISTVNTAFNKTVTFETPAMANLSRGAVFAHDLPNGFDFAGMSQTMRSELPGAMPSILVDRASPTAQATLISEMNQGKYVINYSGHGSTGLWASSSFFSSSSVPNLTNANSPTIFTMLTCLNGFFLNPNSNADSLAEHLVKASNGGAVAAWASSSETTPDIQLMMGQRFFNKIGGGSIPRLGDLIRDAKSVLPNSTDVRFSWVLLGDPMLKVR